MRIKIILTLMLIAASMVFLNRQAGKYIATQIELHRSVFSALQETIAEYSYEKLRVNPVMGAINANSFEFRSDSLHLHSRRVRISLTYADIWRLIQNDSDQPLAGLRSLRLHGRDLVVQHPYLSEARFHMENFSMVYNGPMSEWKDLFSASHPPGHNHRLGLTMSNGSWKTTSKSIAQLPSSTPFPPALRPFTRISAQLEYIASSQQLHIRSVRMDAPDFRLRSNGNARYSLQGWPTQPRSWNAEYDLLATSRDLARLSLPAHWGEITMDTMRVKSRLTSNRIGTDLLRHPLLLPGQTSLHLSQMEWYPPEEWLDRYGVFFSLLDLGEKPLPIHSLKADYRIKEDSLLVDHAALFSRLFDADVQATAYTPAQEPPLLLRGSITITRMNPDFQDFVDAVESLFQFQFPRKDGKLHFELPADPLSPGFGFHPFGAQ